MISSLSLTVLSENRVNKPNLLAEQGLSIFVSTPASNILFDTGQLYATLHNARQLGIDLGSTSQIFLSHGHYDHVGGLRYISREIKLPEIICHPNLFNKKYRLIDDERIDIGVPWDKTELEEGGVKFGFRTHSKEIMPDVWVSGEIPRLTGYEVIDETYQERILESFIHDHLHDDMSLVLNTTRGLVILLGCGHAGVVNTIKHAMRMVNESRIHLIMGGMHLQRATDEKIGKIIQALAKLDPDFIIPLHCTGFRAINQMFNTFHERVLLFNVGDSYTL